MVEKKCPDRPRSEFLPDSQAFHGSTHITHCVFQYSLRPVSGFTISTLYVWCYAIRRLLPLLQLVGSKSFDVVVAYICHLSKHLVDEVLEQR